VNFSFNFGKGMILSSDRQEMVLLSPESANNQVVRLSFGSREIEILLPPECKDVLVIKREEDVDPEPLPDGDRDGLVAYRMAGGMKTKLPIQFS